MTNLYAKIQEVLERFDFKKVQKVMTFLNWTWMGNKEAPTLKELESTAHELLFRAVELYEKQGRHPTGMSCATGGFIASVEVYQDGAARLQLIFYVDYLSA